MKVNVSYIRKKSFVSSKYMDIIIQPSQIAYKLISVNKRAISQRKRPYYVQKKHLQNITFLGIFLFEWAITFNALHYVDLWSFGQKFQKFWKTALRT